MKLFNELSCPILSVINKCKLLTRECVMECLNGLMAKYFRICIVTLLIAMYLVFDMKAHCKS